MIRLLLEPVNLLILDEPTNHLDMRSKDVLKEALKEFDGTVIVVSHDREFLSGLIDKVYEFGNQSVKEHLGGIYEFLEKKKIENLNELEKKPPGSPKTLKSAPAEVGVSWEARKEQQRQIKRLEKAVSDYERKIEKMEAEIKAMEAILTTPEGASNVDLLWQHAELQKKLSGIMDEWTEATIELENCKATNVV
jgi:ATP-binding cassette subfamily F protein 3